MNPHERALELKPERKMQPAERLYAQVETISQLINQEVQDTYGISGLLNLDGSINMRSFSKENKGVYSQEEIAADNKLLADNEIGLAGAHTLKKGSPEQMAAVKQWKEEEKFRKGTQVELAIMALLHKVLRSEFLVVRSAKYDDREASVDSLLVDKQTGEVLCAIDDVYSSSSDQNSTQRKSEKVLNIAKKGGKKVKYGLTIKNGKLNRGQLTNIPVFYLGLTEKQFTTILESVTLPTEPRVTQSEMQIFAGFMKALQEQRENLLALELKSDIRKNIEALDSTFERLNKIAGLETLSKQAA